MQTSISHETSPSRSPSNTRGGRDLSDNLPIYLYGSLNLQYNIIITIALTHYSY